MSRYRWIVLLTLALLVSTAAGDRFWRRMTPLNWWPVTTLSPLISTRRSALKKMAIIWCLRTASRRRSP